MNNESYTRETEDRIRGELEKCPVGKRTFLCGSGLVALVEAYGGKISEHPFYLALLAGGLVIFGALLRRSKLPRIGRHLVKGSRERVDNSDGQPSAVLQ